jgi:hypothetical protein
MKMRLLKINPTLLMQILQGKKKSITSNLPNDLELIDIKYDLFSGQVLVVIRSDDFEDIKQPYPIPNFNLKYVESPKNNSKLLVETKPEIKLTKVRSVNVNQDISAYEKEFSPEQRELLSFKIEGDFLIVKPVQYLKKEWNEINEVVKNIGGEWIKGSIISYWKIPIN